VKCILKVMELVLVKFFTVAFVLAIGVVSANKNKVKAQTPFPECRIGIFINCPDFADKIF